MALTSQAQQLHSSVSSTGVSFGNGPAPQAGVALAAPPTKTQNQRIIGMCPPQFQRVGTDCYSLVPARSTWLEAHFFCKDKNANLAEPAKQADRKLKYFLRRQDQLTGGKAKNKLNFFAQTKLKLLLLLQKTNPFGLAPCTTTLTSTGNGIAVTIWATMHSPWRIQRT